MVQFLKGFIALDIDGTITADTHGLEQEVMATFSNLYQQGWRFIFITGRPFQWGYESLKELSFPYALAVQNGALLIEMPEKKILSRNYLDYEILPDLEAISLSEQTDFVIYSGFENDDYCFFRPNRLSSFICSYVAARTKALSERWEPLETFSTIPVRSFSSVKFFAQKEQAYRISRKLESQLGLHAPPNRDPFNHEFYVVQATHPAATKGSALQKFIQLSGASVPIIAAGDDYNDQSMLELAHVKVVMANAPPEILKMADVIAPPASQKGIIRGLFEAVHLLAKGKLHA